MKKKVTSDLVKVAILNLEEIEKTYLAELSSLSEKNNNIKENLSLEILELKDEVNKLRKERTILSKEKEECNILLKTKEKQLEKYKNLLNLTPGTPENKVELLEYFTNEIIPSISKKIESKHTNKIKEYLDKEILNREEEVGEELYNLVLGTHLEFLFPYLIAGYIEIDYRALKSYIKNPSTLAYKNWKKKIFDIKEISRGHLSCPIYTDVDFGVHNPISFSDKCVIELSAYFINRGNMEYIESLKGFLKKILNSNSLKIKYGLPVKTDVMVYEECENYPDMIRMFLWEYIKNKGN